MNTSISWHQLKNKLYRIVFEADTPAGKAFDVALIFAIIFSIIVVLMESVQGIWKDYSHLLSTLEWVVTVLFTIEYFLRISIVDKPLKYIFSFYGIIDLLSCIPAYLALLTTAGTGLIVIRALRLLRLFRIFKLTRFINAGSFIWEAIKNSRYKIAVFLYAVLMIIIVIGALMYLIEGPASGFDSIPRSMYWVVVTITTVGYGDIAPQTTVGQLIASVVMILGYAIIAVPTGIVTAETIHVKKAKQVPQRRCPRCNAEISGADANYCSVCGERLVKFDHPQSND